MISNNKGGKGRKYRVQDGIQYEQIVFVIRPKSLSTNATTCSLSQYIDVYHKPFTFAKYDSIIVMKFIHAIVKQCLDITSFSL